jgi:ferritin-like metal-binding protein YciE
VKLEHLQDLFVKECQDLYSAEQQIIEALPDMEEAANSPDLKSAFRQHLQETQGQVRRLEQIFDKLGEEAEGDTCKGMEGLVEEGSDLIDEADDADPDVLDAGLIAAAQRVEHYEIASYGCARTYARLLGLNDAAQLLQQTLDEEAATDKKLTAIAEHINVEAKAA